MTRCIGAHLSVAKGLIPAAENMIAMGGNCLQIFSGSPRGWARKPLETVEESARAFRAYCKEKNFSPIFIHALYLVNLASEDPKLAKNSVDGLIYDMKYNALIGGSGVVVHLGSHQGKGFEVVFPALIERLKKILAFTPKESVLLIENSAGQNGKLCSDLAEIRKLFDALDNTTRLGWCMDTCHAHCAGYDLKKLKQEMQTYKLYEQLHVIHFNDAKDPFGSGRDRHENIGKGQLGEVAIKEFLHDKTFSNLPLILEVPGFDGNGSDAKNIALVKKFSA